MLRHCMLWHCMLCSTLRPCFGVLLASFLVRPRRCTVSMSRPSNFWRSLCQILCFVVSFHFFSITITIFVCKTLIGIKCRRIQSPPALSNNSSQLLEAYFPTGRGCFSALHQLYTLFLKEYIIGTKRTLRHAIRLFPSSATRSGTVFFWRCLIVSFFSLRFFLAASKCAIFVFLDFRCYNGIINWHGLKWSLAIVIVILAVEFSTHPIKFVYLERLSIIA
mmetsp:Transcript_5606/g.8615  ORF Transcript_5606/g.8615 Transcript_5606/m.8615 type:complete len:220 (-) Transcript_5606:150-809(-)